MKKGARTLVVGLLLIVVGVGAPALLAFKFFKEQPVKARFIAPGEATVEVDEPGKYYLWHEHKTVFQGQSYSSSPELPAGVQIALYRQASGEEVPFVGGGSISVETGGNKKKSVGHFEIDRPGTYELTVESGPERVMSFSKARFLRGFLLIAGGLVFSGVLCLGGLVAVVLGIVWLAQNRG